MHVLEGIFRRSKAEATRIMLTVHNEGAGIAGVYSKEVAETKATRTVSLARSEGAIPCCSPLSRSEPVRVGVYHHALSRSKLSGPPRRPPSGIPHHEDQGRRQPSRRAFQSG